MAQYFTDFIDYATGAPDGWTRIDDGSGNGLNGNWIIANTSVAGQRGPRTLHHQSISSSIHQRGFFLDELEDQGDGTIELLARFRMDSWTGGTFMGLIINGGHARDGYRLDYRRSPQHLNISIDDSVVASITKSWGVNDWAWVRFRLEDDHLYGSAWAEGTSEPESWDIDIEVPSGSVRSTGGCGVYLDPSTSSNYYTDFFSYAIGGGSSPEHPFTDFGEYPNGPLIDNDDWVDDPQVWDVPDRPEVRTLSGASGGKVVTYQGTQVNGGIGAFHEETLNERNIEALVRIRRSTGTSNGAHWGVALGASGTATGKRGILVGMARHSSRGTEWYLDVNSGGWTTGGMYQFGSYTNGTWYLLRVRLEGDVIKARYWQDGTAEPEEWDVEHTLTSGEIDAIFDGDFWSGIGANNSNNNYDIDTFQFESLAEEDTEAPVARSSTRMLAPLTAGPPPPPIVELEATGSGREGSIQTYVAPVTGTYTIEAFGAQGGMAQRATTLHGGLGARMKGDFELEQGDVLHILVGHEGGFSGDSFAAGGGGTFVVKDDGTPLLIAGGGGGYGVGTSYNNHWRTHASTGTSGRDGFGAGGGGAGSGGTDGDGGDRNGSGTIVASGGGGLLGDGGGSNGSGGNAYVNGGFGGATNQGSEGGFGGGGSNWNSTGWGTCCGGGGYSGGGGGYASSNAAEAAGGGGGSYNAGSNPDNEEEVQWGDGLVVIEAPEDEGDSVGVVSPSLVFGVRSIAPDAVGVAGAFIASDVARASISLPAIVRAGEWIQVNEFFDFSEFDQIDDYLAVEWSGGGRSLVNDVEAIGGRRIQVTVSQTNNRGAFRFVPIRDSAIEGSHDVIVRHWRRELAVVQLRGSGTSSLTGSGYRLRMTGSASFEIRRFIDGSSSIFATGSGEGVFSPNPHMIRFAIEDHGDGSVTVKARIWLPANPEPTEWDVEVLDTDPPPPGWVALGLDRVDFDSTSYSTHSFDTLEATYWTRGGEAHIAPDPFRINARLLAPGVGFDLPVARVNARALPPQISISSAVEVPIAQAQVRALAPGVVSLEHPAYADLILSKSPIGYYRLNDLPPDTDVLADSSGNNHGGFYQGAYELGRPGAFGNGVSATFGGGVGDGAVVPGSNAFSFDGGASANPFVVEAWVRPDSLSSGWILRRMATRMVTATTSRASGYGLWYGNGRFRFVIGDFSLDPLTYGPSYDVPEFELGQWHHVVAVRSGDGTHLYVDGELRDSTSSVTLPSTGNPDLRIGGAPQITASSHPNIPAAWFEGGLDEVSVQPLISTAEEISIRRSVALAEELLEYTNFEEYPTGELVPEGWFRVWGTGAWFIDEADGGQVLRRGQGVNAIALASIQDGESIEIVTKMRYTDDSFVTVTTSSGLALRASGTIGEDSSGYQVHVGVNSISIIQRTSTGTVQRETAASPHISGEWVWIRARIDDNTIRAKSWLPGGNEPEGWAVEWTHAAGYPDGWYGIFSGNSGVVEWDYFSVSRDGGTAPIDDPDRAIEPPLASSSAQFLPPGRSVEVAAPLARASARMLVDGTVESASVEAVAASSAARMRSSSVEISVHASIEAHVARSVVRNPEPIVSTSSLLQAPTASVLIRAPEPRIRSLSAHLWFRALPPSLYLVAHREVAAPKMRRFFMMPSPTVFTNEISASTTFGEHPVANLGQAPPTGWTSRWRTPEGMEIRSGAGAIDGRYLRNRSIFQQNFLTQGFSFDVVGDTRGEAKNVRTLTRARMWKVMTLDGSGTHFAFHVAASHRIMVVLRGNSDTHTTPEIQPGNLFTGYVAADHSRAHVGQDEHGNPTYGRAFVINKYIDSVRSEVGAHDPSIPAWENFAGDLSGDPNTWYYRYQGPIGGGGTGSRVRHNGHVWLCRATQTRHEPTLQNHQQWVREPAHIPFELNNYEEGTWFWLRFEADEDLLRLKVWASGESEPINWQVTGFDTDVVWGWMGVGRGRPVGHDWNPPQPSQGDVDYDYFEASIIEPPDGASPTIEVKPFRLSARARNVQWWPTNSTGWSVTTDFSEQTVDQFPQDWSLQYMAEAFRFNVREVAGTIGGKVLEHISHSADISMYASYDLVHSGTEWKPPGEFLDGQFIVKFRASQPNGAFWVAFRGKEGEHGNETFYAIHGGYGFSSVTGPNSLFNMSKVNNGEWMYVASHLGGGGAATNPQTFAHQFTPNEWYWMRVYVRNVMALNSSGEWIDVVRISARMWHDHEDEPTWWANGWDEGRAIDNFPGGFEQSLPTPPILEPGWLGLGNEAASGTVQYDYLSVFSFRVPSHHKTIGAAPIRSQARMPEPHVDIPRSIEAPTASASSRVLAPTIFATIANVLWPDATINAGGWRTHEGETSNLHLVLDESSYSDESRYARTRRNPSSDAMTLGFPGSAFPGVTYGHLVRYEIRGQGQKVANLTVQLLQGTTVIASWVHSGVGSDEWRLVEQELTASQALAITNYEALRVRMIGEVL